MSCAPAFFFFADWETGWRYALGKRCVIWPPAVSDFAHTRRIASLAVSLSLFFKNRHVLTISNYSLAPYERRVIELLRNSRDKRARKLAKKRVRLAQPPQSLSRPQ